MTTVDTAPPPAPNPTDPKAKDLFKEALNQAIVQMGISLYQTDQVAMSLVEGIKQPDES